MRFLALAAGALLLVGCADGPPDYRHLTDMMTDIETFTTDKGVDETQECIVQHWRVQSWLFDAEPFNDGKYKGIVAQLDFADVYPEDGHTVVKFYSDRGKLDIFRGIPRRVAAIKKCL